MAWSDTIGALSDLIKGGRQSAFADMRRVTVIISSLVHAMKNVHYFNIYFCFFLFFMAACGIDVT